MTRGVGAGVVVGQKIAYADEEVGCRLGEVHWE